MACESQIGQNAGKTSCRLKDFDSLTMDTHVELKKPLP